MSHLLSGMRRARGFAATAILTLALGIGLSTTVFTIADALLLRRLPVGNQDALVVLSGETAKGTPANVPVTLNEIREFEPASRTMSRLAFFEFRGATPVAVRTGDQVYSMAASLVSGSFLETLQSRALLGRALEPNDDIEGAAPVLVLSHRAWTQRFGGDSTVVGRKLTMLSSGQPYTIVGVMPQGLDYPRATDFWVPLVAYSTAGGFLNVVTNELYVLARLRPGATIAEARGELTRFFQRAETPASRRGVGGSVQRLPDIILGDTKPAVLLVTLAAALLLFIACVNVANLLLIRALSRTKEFVVRSALGAGRGRIMWQMLAECAMLSAAGGVIGVGLALAGVKAFVALAPGNIPRVDEIGVNASALLAAIVVTTLTMLFSGLGPAWFMSRVEGYDALRNGSRNTRGGGVRRAAQSLVVAQIALATVSLAASALMTRSLVKLQQVDLAFDPAQLVVANLSMQGDQLPTPLAQRAAVDAALANIAAAPGVEAVTPVFAMPFIGAGGGIDGRISTPSQSAEEKSTNPLVNIEIADVNYFDVLGIHVQRGRAFTSSDRDGTEPVVVVSTSVAQHFWPGQDPIGKRLGSPTRQFTIVGVVPETRYRELTTARPTVYFPLHQSQFGVFAPTTLVVRGARTTAATPGALVPSLRRAVSAAHPALSLVSASSLETLLDAPRAEPRLNTMVLALFAAAALSLSAIGLFAIMSMMVRQRTQEIGIRMALGATTGNVRRMVMLHGLALTAVGLAIGVPDALSVSRLMSSMLFEVSPTDLLSLGAVMVLLVAVAVIATFVPARASMRIEPIIALRSDT